MKRPFNLKQMEQGVSLLLKGMGVDTKSENYRGTPKRVARMYVELFTPKRNNFRSFAETHDEIVLLRGHEVYAVCPHHLLPVRMRVSLGYIPNGRVLGLSKLARTIESVLTEPVLQEAFTTSVVRNLGDQLHPQGVACVVTGRHGCMQCRGVRTRGDVVTSKMVGAFLLNPTARAEFEWLVGRP